MGKAGISRFPAILALATVAGCLATAQSTQPGKLPDVPYIPTSSTLVQAMLKLARVTAGDTVYDLGCGDGRIVITAARDFGARAVGIDINPLRIDEARRNSTQAGVADKVRFEQNDLFSADIKDATVVMVYLTADVNARLRPRLLRDLKPGTRIVSNTFRLGDWKPEKTEWVDGREILLWTVPANTGSK